MRSEIELLAPVGSFESLIAAINAKADSIYFGVGSINMRARSSYNFNLSDLKKISKICQRYKINSYLTLNSIIYQEDISELNIIIEAAIENNITSIIASDPAVLNLLRGRNISVHLSTQLNISNIESVKFYSQFADVMVLARELNLEQIKYISDIIAKEKIIGPSGNLIKLEVFIHGALCMAISGKCYLSQHLHNASANRGACYQVCRRKFTVTDDTGHVLKLDNEFILSPKDLCSIGFLDKIILSGISILKIEGRGRAPEYVKTTVEAYNEALTSYFNDSYNQELVNYLTKKLDTVYNRGFWEGHYLGKDIFDWNTNVAGSKANRKKEYIGKGVKYFPKSKIGEFILEAGILSVGDNIIITGQTTGIIEMIVQEIWVENSKVESIVRGIPFTFYLDRKIRPSDKIYKLIDSSN